MSAPVNDVLPVITGTPGVGDTLTSSTGVWAGDGVRAVYDAGDHTADYPALKAATFNAIVTDGTDTEFLATLAADGMKAWATPGIFTDGAFTLTDDEAVAVATAAVATGGVAALYIADEPPSTASSLIKARANLLTAALPGVPVVFAYYDADTVGDFYTPGLQVALDIYPASHGWDYTLITALADAAGEAGFEYYIVLGAFSDPPDFPLPTPTQLQDMYETAAATAMIGWAVYAWGNTGGSVDDELQNQDGLLEKIAAWPSSSALTFAYQWQRDDLGDLVYVDIGGETADTYTEVLADLGCNVRCAVTATNDDGSTVAYSEPVMFDDSTCTFEWLGVMGSATVTDMGAVNSITVPITTPFPDATANTIPIALVQIMVSPGSATGAGTGMAASDDAVGSDSAVFGTRWSPYGLGDPSGSSADPPDFGPPNFYGGSSLIPSPVDGDLITTGMIMGAMFGSPDSITVELSGDFADQDWISVVVYGLTGVIVYAEDTATPHILIDTGGVTDCPDIGSGPCTLPWDVSYAGDSGPGFATYLFLGAPPSVADLAVSSPTDGAWTVEAPLEDPGATNQFWFAWRNMGIADTVQVDTVDAGVNLDASGYNASVGAIGCGDLDVPDALDITVTATLIESTTFNRYVVTIVDSAGIPSDLASHRVTPYWRVLEAPGGGPGLDGTWSEAATDESSDGRYVVQNPIDSGFYVDVPAETAYTLRAFLYDGLLSDELDVTLDGPGPTGSNPYLHAHFSIV